MKKNLVPVLALTIGMLLIVLAISMDGGTFMMFWSVTSVLITFFGSLAAVLISYPSQYVRRIPAILRKVVSEPSNLKEDYVSYFSDLSRKARKEGLLSLEDDAADLDDPFLKRGLQMAIDGMEQDTIRDIMEMEIDALEERHKPGENIFRTWGELAPAFGMLGTLTGLIIMLSGLDDPSQIGAGMATALITTFYGSLLANLIFIPIANNLKSQTEAESFQMEMIIDGVQAIQSGSNPRIVEEKLSAYLSPKERQEWQEKAEREDNSEVVSDHA